MELTVSSHLSSTELGDSLGSGNLRWRVYQRCRETLIIKEKDYQMEYIPGFCCDLEKDIGI